MYLCPYRVDSSVTTCDDCGLPGAVGSVSGGDRSLCDPCAGLAATDLPVRVSPIGRGDLELLLAWRSNPDIYRHFRRQSGPLDWDEHVRWFESRPPERHDFLVPYSGRRVGVVSVDKMDEVGIYLGDHSARGQGVATAALNWLCARFNERAPLFAEIHENNEASNRLFERCGFRRTGRENGWLQYAYDP
jgi:RimJ/RimL family protein N-acetyltransferase